MQDEHSVRRRGLVAWFAVAGLVLTASAGSAANDLTPLVDARYDEAVSLASDLFDYAELGYLETRSAERLAGYLEGNGFSVERAVAGIPTAFVAERGSGGPVIGILAEFDALPGLSQAPVPRRQPVVPDAPGQLAATICLAAPRPPRRW